MVNDVVVSFDSWCKNHGLVVNFSKTVALCIGGLTNRTLISNNYKLSINGSTIEWVESARNLGVYFDSGLDFQKHYTEVYKRSMYRLIY